jgi:hypothetical protein
LFLVLCFAFLRAQRLRSVLRGVLTFRNMAGRF